MGMGKNFIGFSWGLVFLSACSAHQKFEPPPVQLKEDRFQSAQTADFAEPGLWWRVFKSLEIDAFMEEAINHNPGLRASRARIEQRLAQYEVTWAALVPQGQAEISASHQQLGTGQSKVESNRFSLGLSLSYELDLFGKNQSALTAAQFDLLASLEDYKASLADLSKTLISGWFALAESKAQAALLEETAQADRANLDLVEGSYKVGTAKAADVLQAQEQVMGTELQLAQTKALLLTREHALMIQAGRYPRKEQGFSPVGLEVKLEPPKPGLPSTLVQRRPDLRRALLQLRAQDARIAQAEAARYPQFSLSSSVGYQSGQLSGITDPGNAFWNLVGNLTLPIFDGGKRRAEVRRQEGILSEQLALYNQTLLKAFGEVEDALGQLKLLDQQIALQKNQIEISKQKLELTKDGFRQGITDWFQVIAAQNQYYNVQKGLLTTRRAWIDQQVGLYLAIGGNWTDGYLKQVAQEEALKLRDKE